MNRRVTFAVGVLAASTVAVALLFVLLASSSNTVLASEPAQAPQVFAPADVVTFTILHTNDFHGNLESDYKGRGGAAYMANVIDDVRAAKGADNVLLVDAGDVYFGAPPISQLLLGESTIDIYNLMGYDVAAFGNHEFDKGQTVLVSRTMQSNFPWIGANIVVSGTDWTHPDWVTPYVTLTVGSPTAVTLGIIGLDTDETPLVTIKGATDGLVFKDLTETVLYYYDEVMAQSDALVVLAHMGTEDSGMYKGLSTVAQELVDAGKPVDLMIGGHQHEYMDTPTVVSDTTIIVAYQYGRVLGDAEVAIDTATKSLSVVNYAYHTISNTLAYNSVISDRVAYWAGQVVTQVNQVVGHTYISLTRDYNAESIVGDLVADSMLWKADEYDDGEVNGSVDIALTNPGGLRADIEVPAGTAALPYTITWGATFNILPFANTLYYMDLTGAQVQTLLDQGATLFKGMVQSSGISFYWYNDTGDDAPNVWGAYGVMVNGVPMERDAVYRVVTNNFLAGGQDGWVTFAEGTNRWDSYFDMQEGLNEYIDTVLGGVIEADDISMGRAMRLDEIVTVMKDVVPTDDVSPGDTVTYTIVLENNSGITATDLVMTDTLPPEVDFGGWVYEGSASAMMPGPGGDEIVWGPWTVESGTTITYVFTATLKTGSAYLGIPVVNVVEFVSAEAGSGSDEAVFNSEGGPSILYLPLVLRYVSTGK